MRLFCLLALMTVNSAVYASLPPDDELEAAEQDAVLSAAEGMKTAPADEVASLFDIFIEQLQNAQPSAPAPSAPPAGQLHCRSIVGMASFYGNELRGHRTASGERFIPGGLTAAHRTLPFNTQVRVKNLNTGREVTVRINDRGPFVRGRIIDISAGAARQIGMTVTSKVSLETCL